MDNMARAEPWLSAEEVAEHLGVVKETVYRWVRRAGLPAHRVGRLLKFRLSEVDSWVAHRGAHREASGTES